MKIKLICFLMLMFAGIVQSQTFMDFMSELYGTPDSLRQAKVDSFMQSTESFPVTEDTLAHFVYSGSGSNLAVPGDFSGWNPANAPMTNVSPTNFWYRTEAFDDDARLDYKFVYNGNTWILDPRNPYFAPGGFGNNSELRMPQYIPPWEINYNPVIPHGTLEDTSFYSTNLGNSRTVRVYLPPGYSESAERYSVVLVHDGLEYISFSKMNTVIDNLISENMIRPVIGVFVPPVDRSPEYISGKQNEFTAFIAEEVIPWVDGKYRTINDASARMTLGSSAGGNISLWLAMTHPEIFGIAAPFSPYIEDDIQNYFNENDKMDLKIFMIHGKYDHLAAIHISVDNFLPILEQKGYEFEYGEYPEGHSYGFWRAYTAEALMYAFPPLPTDIEDDENIPDAIALYQNYPNPFNPTTTIKYTIPAVKTGHGQSLQVKLTVYDMLGREITTLVDKMQPAGNYSVQFNAAGLSSGIYFYRLSVSGVHSSMRKMILLN